MMINKTNDWLVFGFQRNLFTGAGKENKKKHAEHEHIFRSSWNFDAELRIYGAQITRLIHAAHLDSGDER